MMPQSTYLRTFVVSASVFLFSILPCSASSNQRYLFTNNDYSQGNSSTVYVIGAQGGLKKKAVVVTHGIGFDGLGSVSTQRILVSHDKHGDCAYLSEDRSIGGHAHPAVTTISVANLRIVGSFTGSPTDQVYTLGMGLAMNPSYIYADFSGSQTIGTYKRLPGCKLKFIRSIPAVGLNQGVVEGMKARNHVLVVNYSDGSIQSFDISNGVPASNNDLQYSTGYTNYGDVPASVDLSSDAHYAVFGDSGGLVEVSDISSGKLAATIPYQGLGTSSPLGFVYLSPDEKLLYISNFSTSQISAAWFDRSNGTLAAGCTSAPLKNSNFMAGLALQKTTGSGSVVYVAEPDRFIGAVRFTASGSSCSFTELNDSPTYDKRAWTLESIGVFPPRRF